MEEEIYKRKLQLLKDQYERNVNAVTQEYDDFKKRSKISEIIQSLSQHLADPEKAQRLSVIVEMKKHWSERGNYASASDKLIDFSQVTYTSIKSNFLETQKEYHG